jgi:ABC-type uncharacterized transport system substrate-binding protein
VAIFLGALRKGLNELGYVEGKNLELLNRFADYHYDRFDGLAAELVKAKVDLIVGSLSPAAIAPKRQTASVPIIFVGSGDPIGMGLVDTLARPNLPPGKVVTGASRREACTRVVSWKISARSAANMAAMLAWSVGGLLATWV